MILRKPYAFLIRYFKIIHIFLFIMCCFLLFKLRSIYVFFQEYVKTDTYQYIENIAEKYIGLPMIIVSILIFVSAILILLLMKKKEKPVLFYRILIVYSFSLIILIIFYYNFYKSLEFQIYDRSVLSIYRDIGGLFYYTMFFYIGFTFIRGFGFDIKKFSFENDLKMLNITESDNEEFELAVNIDKENIVNTIRKEKRFTKYFLKENALVISIIIIIALAITGIYLYNYYFVENVIYNQGEKIISNNISYQINNVYLTNRDKNNNVLENDYIIVDISIINLNNENQSIDLLKTRLVNGEKKYYPIISQYNYFDDIGIGYDNQVLKTNNEYKYILVFKIDNLFLNKDDLYLDVYDHEIYKNNELKIEYKRILLNIHKLIDKNILDVEIGNEVLLNGNFIQNGIFTLNNYDFGNSFVHSYQECKNNDCISYQKVIKSEQYLPVFKIGYDISNLDFNKISNYFSLICKDNVSSNDVELRLKLLYNDENVAYFEIEKEINDYIFQSMNINIRGNIYRIKLT